MVLVKYVIIDRRNRTEGTYRKETHEDLIDTGSLTDPLEIGKFIHDHDYGVGDKRFYVKVLGVQE